LKKHGYRVIPVNPSEDEVLGERAYDTVDQFPDKVDVVNVFLRPEKTPKIAEDAVGAGVKVLWLQQGITNPEACRIAQEGGVSATSRTNASRVGRPQRLYGLCRAYVAISLASNSFSSAMYCSITRLNRG
jgi:hypothetical protein